MDTLLELFMETNHFIRVGKIIVNETSQEFVEKIV